MKNYIISLCCPNEEEIEAENLKEAQKIAEQMAEDWSNDNEHYVVSNIYEVED